MASTRSRRKPNGSNSLEAKAREARIFRETKETRIRLALNLDGEGRSRIDTGIPFFDHLLTLLAKHSLFDLDLRVKGDIEVDFHHTVEDCGIGLGMAIDQALGDRAGIRRYSFGYLPMDETLVRVAIDISGRPLFVFRPPRGVKLMTLYAGTFPAQLIVEFLRALAQRAAFTLHVHVLETEEIHHMLEAIIKGVARALRFAVERDLRVKGIPSSKGVL
ncbi:MAG: imidazoleglycerol-phosphate dehydratase HisB [Methylacidiphilales bacterium]|nr:imidazoleglycerol-phosphate dehydratase HisB [Candidatus Methylacidiphilales bacterium]MDW8350099.1 imidazoleglycerol-phosphate dehydratase HisB [Verrucomicrobiae bacterium]